MNITDLDALYGTGLLTTDCIHAAMTGGTAGDLELLLFVVARDRSIGGVAERVIVRCGPATMVEWDWKELPF